MKYRLFTNDRGRKDGIPMYSALKDVEAETPEAAVSTVVWYLRIAPLAPAKAIPWPAEDQESKDWLAKHVG